MVAVERNPAARMMAHAATTPTAASAAATRTMATTPHTFHIHAFAVMLSYLQAILGLVGRIALCTSAQGPVPSA